MAVDETDTELAEDTSSEDTDVDLEDIEVDPADIDSAESEEDESDSDVESDDEDTKEETEDESNEESEAEAEEQPEAEPSDEDKQKAFNREMAQKRIQEKEQRGQGIKAEQAKYLEEAEDPRDEALRQLQIDAYDNRVESNTNKLTNGYERAVKDFDVLRSDDPVIKAEIDRAIDDFEALHVKLDAYGNPTQVSGDLYTYLQTKADSITKLSGLGARKQVTDKTREKSKTSITPSRAPREPKKDADLDAFDEEAYK